MQAVILVGGIGTRLRPITFNTPKPMVPINDIPFLEYLIIYFKKQGINDFIFLTGHLSEKIEKYFGDGSKLGVRIRYSKEEKPLGTAGAIKNAEPFLEEEFIALNGDTFLEIDLNKFIKNHKEKQQLISIVVIEKEGNRYGSIELKSGIITNFAEKEKSTNFINGGIYLINKKVIRNMPSNICLSIEKDIFPKYNGKMAGFITKGYFIDIGTFESYNKFKKEAKKVFDILLK